MFLICHKNSDENADDKGYMIEIVIVSHRHGKSDDSAHEVDDSDNNNNCHDDNAECKRARST